MTEPRSRPPRAVDATELAERHQRAQAAARRLHTVQRWVGSTLTVIMVWSLAIGLVFAAAGLGRSDGDKIGILVMAGLMGLGGFVGATAIHGRLLPHWTWLLGPVPALIGAWWIFWR